MNPICNLLPTAAATCLAAAGAWGDDLCRSAWVRDCLVHSILPEGGRHGVPVIMVPGLNLSSYIFLTTPDGREGWAQMFAEDGYDVHVINDPDFDFATGGFSVAPFTVPAGGPPADSSSSPGWQQDVWRRWGFGDSQGSPYADTRFPTGEFEIFAANYPYVGDSADSYSGGIVSLLEEVGPAIVMAHSAGGPQALAAALARPDLVVGFIMIEPTGPPDAGDFPALAGLSMLGVYGDYISSRNQTSRKADTEAAAVLFAQNGGAGEVISLPDDRRIHGNTHLMMQDDNNAFIADVIMDWLAEHVDTGAFPTQLSLHLDEAGQLIVTSPVMGTWESSVDLSEWRSVSPVESRELVVTPDKAQEFFRQAD